MYINCITNFKSSVLVVVSQMSSTQAPNIFQPKGVTLPFEPKFPTAYSIRVSPAGQNKGPSCRPK